MLDVYWPDEANIDKCIRAEAEELSDRVLLAVHEPMFLVRSLSEINEKKEFSTNAEDALLENLISSNRPVPILGDSGSGKSHLIRWLDIKLKSSELTKDWIVRRIPKSASLREVLSILLDGLEGEIFEKARDKVKSVGESINARKIAEHLIVNINNQLVNIYDTALAEKETLRQSKQIISPERVNLLKATITHAHPESLSSLLGDTNYKKYLLDEKSGCIYQIAKRLTSGGTTEEIDIGNYALKPEDLDVERNMSDYSELSGDAFNYISKKHLLTKEQSRIDAVNILNSVLSDACNDIYQQFFQLHGGNFGDLFLEIRKSLKDRTLVILIEDMSLVTAIENDLITSLVREERRDGIKELCDVKSALAVTTGYEGYLKHRNSIMGRNSGYEWTITKTVDNSESLYDRVEDFCGRYINAARFGEDNLSESILNAEERIWQSNNKDTDTLVGEFGYSKSGFPLFPFNKPALRAFADKLCRNSVSGQIVFNPRIILKHVLMENLSTYRTGYMQGKFPPIGFADIDCSGAMSQDLTKHIFSDLKRAESFAAIWGKGAKNLSELASLVTPDVATEFGLTELAQALSQITPSSVKPTVNYQAPTAPEVTKIKEQKVVPTELINIDDKVEVWFKKKDIPQEEANVLRKFMCRVFETRISNFLGWYSIQDFPKVSSGSTYNIDIPYNVNNPRKSLLSLELKGKKFSQDPSLYKAFITAVLSFDKHGDWNYINGFSDRCTTENFIAQWLPDSIDSLVELQRREQLQIRLASHLKLAYTLEPVLKNKSTAERLKFLCLQNQDREANNQKLLIRYPDTGIEEWDQIKNRVISQWDETQSAWLKLVSNNNHAIIGDLVKKAMRGITIDVIADASMIQKTSLNMQNEFLSLRTLQEISLKEDFELTFNKLILLIEKMSQHNQYLNMENELTARQLKNRIVDLLKGDCWLSIKSLLVLFEPFEVLKVVTAFQNIRLQELKKVKEIVDCFQILKKNNLLRIVNENNALGGDQRIRKQKSVSHKIASMKEKIQILMEKEVNDDQ